MTRKTKWIGVKLYTGLCILILVAFMGNIWYQNCQNTHKTIETVDEEVRR